MSPLLIDFMKHIRDECDFLIDMSARTSLDGFIADPVLRRAGV